MNVKKDYQRALMKVCFAILLIVDASYIEFKLILN